MIRTVLFTALVLSGPAIAAESTSIVGTWQREPAPGLATIEQLTFGKDGKLWADGRQLVGGYQVAGDKVTAKSRFGETYAYQLMADGRLCVFPGPAVMPLARDRSASPGARLCYQKLSQST